MRGHQDTNRARPASISGGVLAGALATVTMDAAMVLASRVAPDAFASDKIGLELIGRWAGGLARGRRRQADMTAEPELRGELAMGLATHYLTGITLTEAYVVLLRRAGLGPGLVKATAYGVATAVLPLLVLYPSMGYGCCARRSGDASASCASCCSGTRRSVWGSGCGRRIRADVAPRGEKRHHAVRRRASPDEGDEPPPHAPAVVGIAGMLLDEPRLLAAALRLEEGRRDAHGQQDQRR